MADDDGKLVVKVLKTEQQQQPPASGSNGDGGGFITTTTTYNVTTVIPPGGTACLVMRMQQDGPYSRAMSYSAVAIPRQRSDDELVVLVGSRCERAQERRERGTEARGG